MAFHRLPLSGMYQSRKTIKQRLRIPNPLFLAEIILLQVLGNFANSSYAPLTIFIRNSFHINEASLGLITSGAFAGAMAVSLISGMIVDRLGPHRTLRISYGFIALGSLLAFFSITYGELVAAYFIIGFGYGMVTPATNTSIMDHYYPDHASPMGFKQSGVPMGTILAAIVLPLIVLNYSLRIAFFILFIVSGIIALLIRGERNYNTEHEGSRGALRDMHQVFHSRILILVSIITAFLSWGQQSIFTYFVQYMHFGLGYYKLLAETLFIVLLLGSVLGRIVWPLLTQRLFGGHRVKNYSLIMVLTGIAFVALPLITGSVFLSGLMAVVMGFTAVAWNSNYVTMISEIAPKGKVGIYSGTSMMIISFGSILGTPISGYMIDASNGVYLYMWVTLGIILITVSMILLLTYSRILGEIKDTRLKI